MKLTNGQAGTAIGCRSPLGGDSEVPFLGGQPVLRTLITPRLTSPKTLEQISSRSNVMDLAHANHELRYHRDSSRGASRSNGGLALPEYWPTMRLHGWPQLLWCASGPCDVQLEAAAYIFAVSRYKVISLEGTCKITAGNFELVLISSRWLTPQLTDKLSSLYKPSLFNSRTRTVRCR